MIEVFAVLVWCLVLYVIGLWQGYHTGRDESDRRIHDAAKLAVQGKVWTP